jgi:glycine cleavage system H protein
VDPDDRKYTEEHEWVQLTGDVATVGITRYAQDQLGDIVYVELPKVGARVEQSQAFGVVESVKTATHLYAPLSGEVVEVNREVVDHPELVNQDPYGAGWMIKVRPSNPGELDRLLDAAAYARHVGG